MVKRKQEKNSNSQNFKRINLTKVNLKNINVELKLKSQFWEAEAYHQDFANKNELKYKFYRFSCGRDQKLDKLWKENARSLNAWSE